MLCYFDVLKPYFKIGCKCWQMSHVNSDCHGIQCSHRLGLGTCVYSLSRLYIPRYPGGRVG